MEENLNEQGSGTENPIVIGDFTPKRKFLTFVSAVNGARVRFLRDIAFLKGEKLSGVLEGVIFKITICDEGTIKFEEEETTQTDKAQRQRLLDDIDSMDITGYAQKFVVASLEFNDVNGDRCYLEVEHQKPIDKLKSLFDEMDKEEETKEEVKISDKGLSVLDALFGDEDKPVGMIGRFLNKVKGVGKSEESTEEVVEPETEVVAKSYMEEQFERLNAEKVDELKTRVSDKQDDVKKYQKEISFSESKLKEAKEALGILETRLDSMYPGDEPNGHVFFVSEEQKNETGLDESTKEIADKIADLMNLKKEVLFNYLTGGFYKIKIANKEDFENVETKFDREILSKVISIDTSAKMSLIGNGEFEYRGDLTWHQIVDKMIRKGFEQEPDFDKYCNSNSYDTSVLNDGPEEPVDVLTPSNIKDVILAEISRNKDSEDKPETEFKSVKLTSYTEPTTLIVIGTLDHNENSDFSITDDYNNFNVRIGGVETKAKRKYGYESDGFVSIMTLDEFKQFKQKNPLLEEDGGGCDSFIIPNFVGDIEVGVKLSDDTYSTDFNFSDYILHQNCFNDDDVEDIFMNFPEGTEIIDMENHQFPTQVIRDLKLDKILN